MIGWFHSSDATCLEFSITGITTCWEQCRWPSWRSKKLPTPGSFWKFPAGPGYRSMSGRWSPLGHWNSGDFWIMYFMWSDLEGTFFWGGIPVFWGDLQSMLSYDVSSFKYDWSVRWCDFFGQVLSSTIFWGAAFVLLGSAGELERERSFLTFAPENLEDFWRFLILLVLSREWMGMGEWDHYQ